MKNTLIVAVTRLAVASLGRLPRPALRVLGRGLGRLAHACLFRTRSLAKANLEIAFPDRTPDARARLAHRAFVMLGELLGETFARVAPRPDLPAPLSFDGETSRATLRAAMENPRGTVLLSAHLGPYEDVARSLLHHGVPLLAITKGAYDPRLDFVFERLRRGVPSVARDEPGAPMRMVRHLRAGGVLGIPMDLASRVPSVDAPFFGRPARTALGPARIALRTGASVVVCTAAPAAEGSYALRVTSVEVDDLPSHDRSDDGSGATAAERELLARANRELCARISALPEAWPWMHPRFGPPTRGSDVRVSGLPRLETR